MEDRSHGIKNSPRRKSRQRTSTARRETACQLWHLLLSSHALPQVNYLETVKSFVDHARAAGLELVESLDKTTSMAMHFQTLVEVIFFYSLSFSLVALYSRLLFSVFFCRVRRQQCVSAV